MNDLAFMFHDSPRKYGVNHATWRPNQYELFKEVSKHPGEVIVAEMGTGSGKSAVVAAMGHDENVLLVAHSLALLDQYQDLYSFSIIKGRQEYPCVLEDKVDAWQSMYKFEPTAADCHFSPMVKCPVAHKCPYLIAKHSALNAKRAACTYRYLGVSRLMKERPGHIVFDEAHDAAEELIRFNEFAYLKTTLRKYKLPKFPFSQYGETNKGAILRTTDLMQIATWLTTCATILYVAKDEDDKEATKQRKMHDRFIRMSESLFNVIFFLQIKPYEISLKALTAEAVVRQVFASKTTKLLMSATIGNPKPLADALGINKYKFLTFDHPVPVTHRSIKKLGVERMTQRNLKERPGLYKAQAVKIWEWIMQMPPSWRGLILTTSYKKIEELYRHILVPSSIVPYPRRVLRQQKGQKVSRLVQDFITDVRPGDIMIGTIQGWGSGLDLRGEIARWVVIAGVPHTNPTDQYMKARREIEGGQAYQKWVTFNQVMQACGRISRGEIDELTDDWLPNYAALADGSALSPLAMKNYGQWFLDALI